MAYEIDVYTVASTTIGCILCCKCGVLIQPNAANMCAKCLHTEFDITEGLPSSVSITYCPECESYLQPPNSWIQAQLESPRLLEFCCKRLKGLKEVKIHDREFIWTEPHSKRIKVKFILKKEVNRVELMRDHIVEYHVVWRLCTSCSRVQADADQWEAAVQLRQRVSHRRTLLFLEQLILKHDAAKRAIRIRQVEQGIDFFFNNCSHGQSFVAFLRKVSPVRVVEGRKLISEDKKSNVSRFRYTFSVEISPICREDLICLPVEVSRSLGSLGPLVICSKVGNSIALFDPKLENPVQKSIHAGKYWDLPFKALLSSRELVEYIVLDVDACYEKYVDGGRYVLADVEVARVSDLGRNDTRFSVKTHLGHLLAPGDHALGYDLHRANLDDTELEKYKRLVIPDVILIKKSYEKKARSWKLESLKMEVDESGRGRVGDDEENSDYQLFLRDLEEMPELMSTLSLNMASTADGECVASSVVGGKVDDFDLDDEEGCDDFMEE